MAFRQCYPATAFDAHLLLFQRRTGDLVPMRRFALLLLVCSLSSALSVSAQPAPQTPAPAQPPVAAPATACAPAPVHPHTASAPRRSRRAKPCLVPFHRGSVERPGEPAAPERFPGAPSRGSVPAASNAPN